MIRPTASATNAARCKPRASGDDPDKIVEYRVRIA